MRPKFPKVKELADLIKHLKTRIGSEYRSCGQDPDDTTPQMDITIGCNPETGGWSYQTGDNSFHGGAYGYPIWAMATIGRRSNSHRIALYLIDKIKDEYLQ